MFATKTKTTETFVLPEEFDYYTQSGYTIFMSKPTMFGTYRAVKIEMIRERLKDTSQVDQQKEYSKPVIFLNRLLSNFIPN